jgi:hypothetical protein
VYPVCFGLLSSAKNGFHQGITAKEASRCFGQEHDYLSVFNKSLLCRIRKKIIILLATAVSLLVITGVTIGLVFGLRKGKMPQTFLLCRYHAKIDSNGIEKIEAKCSINIDLSRRLMRRKDRSNRLDKCLSYRVLANLLSSGALQLKYIDMTARYLSRDFQRAIEGSVQFIARNLCRRWFIHSRQIFSSCSSSR